MTHSRALSLVLTSSIVFATMVGCAVAKNEGSEQPSGSSAQRQISDATSIVQRTDGRFDVTCKNGSRELDSEAMILANKICLKGKVVTASTDPFDPASCTGAFMTTEQALGHLDIANGKFEANIGRFSSALRQRNCFPGAACGAWKDAAAAVHAAFRGSGGSGYEASSGVTPYYNQVFLLSGTVALDYDHNKPMMEIIGETPVGVFAAVAPHMYFDDVDPTTQPTALMLRPTVVPTGSYFVGPVTVGENGTPLMFQSSIITATG
ncbi:MAG: hypothetical protein NVSMB1_09410 [Polyangiales bacterium]